MKSPFEIRSDLLALAQEHVESQYKANVDFATQTFQMLVAQGKEVKENFSKYLPKVFTFEEVMSKAKEMYAFVDGKGSK
jgi:uncharacterized membrane protein YecN with MAPEG domain